MFAYHLSGPGLPFPTPCRCTPSPRSPLVSPRLWSIPACSSRRSPLVPLVCRCVYLSVFVCCRVRLSSITVYSGLMGPKVIAVPRFDGKLQASTSEMVGCVNGNCVISDSEFVVVDALQCRIGRSIWFSNPVQIHYGARH